jgi:hypothetical protein
MSTVGQGLSMIDWMEPDMPGLSTLRPSPWSLLPIVCVCGLCLVLTLVWLLAVLWYVRRHGAHPSGSIGKVADREVRSEAGTTKRAELSGDGQDHSDRMSPEDARLIVPRRMG